MLLITQLLYVIYKSENNYVYRNGTTVPTICASGDTTDICRDYDTQRNVTVDQLTTEGNSKEIRWTSETPSQNTNEEEEDDEELVSNVNNNASALATTTRPPLNEDDDHLMTTSATSSIAAPTNLLNLINITFPAATLTVLNNESTAAAPTSTNSEEGGTEDSTASFTLIANYSAETTVAPNAPNISTFKQWNITTKAATASKPLVPPYFNDSKQITQTQQQQRQYFINTSRCHIPFIDPFTSEARKIFKPSHSTGCTVDKAIVTAGFDELTNEYVLQTNYTVARDFIKNATEETVADDLLCCYRQIERSGRGGYADREFKLLPCTNFHQDFVVPSHVNGVIVDCKSKATGKLLQQDAFSFIQANATYEKENKRNETESPKEGHRPLGILLIGMDSLSRMNFRRNMPETFKYLVDKGWYELKGYNKVGDNTLPNLMALLSGYTAETTKTKCKPTTNGGLDNCNFIWTKFHEHGFATAYAEDTTTISTFNYKIKGFMKPPTDYYYRPIALALEKTMHKKTKAGLNYCVGRRQFGEYIYDYGLEFATRYRNQSHFGLFWTNSFSHNAYDTAATMDTTMLKYLEDIELRGILESSAIIFFSDHGRRWGPLLKLSEGFLEERLPMFFISLPSWFKREYPSMASNLEVNQRRLTTPFDIYMTMQQLLHMTAPAYNMTPAYDCPKAQSILQEIPEDRICEQACIPESWCTCIPYMLQPTGSAVVHTVTQLILNEMNKYFVTRNITSLCSDLTLHEITRAKLRDVDLSSRPSNIATYMIEFVTNPKTKPLTEFSATADYDAKRQRITLNVEDISRQSKYEDTAKCIDDKQAKKYCICKNSLKSS